MKNAEAGVTMVAQGINHPVSVAASYMGRIGILNRVPNPRSSRKKAKTAYQSAMSMLNFYINRAGKNLKPDQKKVLEKAKEELRKIAT